MPQLCRGGILPNPYPPGNGNGGVLELLPGGYVSRGRGLIAANMIHVHTGPSLVGCGFVLISSVEPPAQRLVCVLVSSLSAIDEFNLI